MSKFSCLLLAAGQSVRMGGANKLLLPINGTGILKRTLREIQQLPLQEVVVVTGSEREKIEAELSQLKPQLAHNQDFEKGMHSSIRVGLLSLKKTCDAFFVCLGDQPYFSSSQMEKLQEAFQTQKGHKIFTLTHQGQNGHPVLISSEFISEILQEKDGDYGLGYLLRRYPKEVFSLRAGPEVLIDIDSPEDYKTFQHDSSDPMEEFHREVARLRKSRSTFSVATVVEVMGSASAKLGSKAIFNEDGRNLLGWVGGGCAERFLGEESRRAIQEKRPRTVLADLDDEIFGLGVACGGKMKVFIEPYIPSETITIAESAQFKNEIRALGGFYGINFKQDTHLPQDQTPEDLLLSMARAIGEHRGRSLRSMRMIKEVPGVFLPTPAPIKSQVTIVGRTRITEALARHFTLLGHSVRAIGPDLKQEDYPSQVQCSCLEDSYESLEFREGEIVVIAAHTAQDPQLVAKAIKQKSSHVAMIGSYKRSLEVLDHLGLLNAEVRHPLFIPAGLDIDGKNPDEIALSVVAEVLALKKGES